MGMKASQITGVSIVASAVCSGTDQRKYQSSAPLAVVRGIHRWPVGSPHKGPVTRKMFPFDDVIMIKVLCANPVVVKGTLSVYILAYNCIVLIPIWNMPLRQCVSNHRPLGCLFNMWANIRDNTKLLHHEPFVRGSHRLPVNWLCYRKWSPRARQISTEIALDLDINQELICWPSDTLCFAKRATF